MTAPDIWPVPEAAECCFLLYNHKLRMDIPATTTGTRNPERKNSLRRNLSATLVAAFIVLCAVTGLQWAQIPTITKNSFAMPQGILLTDRNGGELYRFYRTDDRIDLPIDTFPKSLRDAVIAIEDRRFFGRTCVDIRAILRAIVANFSEFKSQGASTITQQLIRNSFDLRDKTLSRKILELSLACKMESTLGKNDILELYLNHASFGGTSYGAQEASHMYFNTDVRNISVAQSAVLAALLQRPSYLSPYGPHKMTTVTGETLRAIRQGKITSPGDIPEETIELGLIGSRYATAKGDFFLPGRADDVLGLMLRAGSVDQKTFDAATRELRTMTFQSPDHPVSTPYFPTLVEKETQELPGIGDNCRLLSSGCTITSTLDPELQAVAERIVSGHAQEIREKYRAQNIALVAIDRRTRQIVAYIGNVDYSDKESGARIDMAQSPRQPGSSFKPFVYATAFEQGYTPASFVLDGPLTAGNMHPKNYEGGYHGWTSIRHALSASRNIPAIRTFFMVGGEDPILQEAARAGVTEPLERRNFARQESPGYSYGYPLAIGSAEVPLIQMVQGYATLANNGAFQLVTSIAEIRDGHDKIVYSSDDRPAPSQAMHPLIARELTSILSDSKFRPTKYWDELLTLDGIESAVKTGTSNQCAEIDLKTSTCAAMLPADVWTIGYTPSFVVGVWVGNATRRPLTGDADGLNVASPLWKEFLEEAHALYPSEPRQFSASMTFDKRAKDGFYQPPTKTVQQ